MCAVSLNIEGPTLDYKAVVAAVVVSRSVVSALSDCNLCVVNVYLLVVELNERVRYLPLAKE